MRRRESPASAGRARSTSGSMLISSSGIPNWNSSPMARTPADAFAASSSEPTSVDSASTSAESRWERRLANSSRIDPLEASLRSTSNAYCGELKVRLKPFRRTVGGCVEISRRAFIQTTIAGGATLSAFGFDVAPLQAQARTLKIAHTSETRSTCPYCSVSCGVIIHTLGDKAKKAVPKVVHVEGDADHPINRGTLCPKGASPEQDILKERRLLKPQVRRPGSDRWDDIGWDQALDEIGRWVKKTRDATF